MFVAFIYETNQLQIYVQPFGFTNFYRFFLASNVSHLETCDTFIRIRTCFYSSRRLSTGLANAALMAWKLTVTMVIKSASTAASTKTTQLMAIR